MARKRNDALRSPIRMAVQQNPSLSIRQIEALIPGSYRSIINEVRVAMREGGDDGSIPPPSLPPPDERPPEPPQPPDPSQSEISACLVALIRATRGRLDNGETHEDIVRTIKNPMILLRIAREIQGFLSEYMKALSERIATERVVFDEDQALEERE